MKIIQGTEIHCESKEKLVRKSKGRILWEPGIIILFVTQHSCMLVINEAC